MDKYASDRSFTDYVHTNLAIPHIYIPLGWQEKQVAKEELEQLDLHHGIDYFFENEKGHIVKVQERFRDNFYQKYNDITLRYQRDFHRDTTRQKSEYYKMEADYLVYGITDGSKFVEKRSTLHSFVKYVVIDLRLLYEHISLGAISIQSGGNYSRIAEGKMIVPIKDNHDRSSSFIVFEVPQLHQLWPESGLIVAQKGYL
jgi:hypothetical protein